MDNKIETIKHQIECLSIDELNNYLDIEIAKAREESSKSPSDSHMNFYLEGKIEKVFFDRLVYFRNMTKDFKLSISDCKSKLNINYEKIKRINNEIEINNKKGISLFSEFSETIKKLLNTLSNGSIFSLLNEEPLRKLDIALDNENEITYQYVEDVLKSINYMPRGISRLSHSVFVIDGEFEKYLELKERLESLYKELTSERFINTKKTQYKLEEERDALYQNPSKIRAQMVSWRKIAMTCFNIQYTDEQLRTNSLLLTCE